MFTFTSGCVRGSIKCRQKLIAERNVRWPKASSDLQHSGIACDRPTFLENFQRWSTTLMVNVTIGSNTISQLLCRGEIECCWLAWLRCAYFCASLNTYVALSSSALHYLILHTEFCYIIFSRLCLRPWDCGRWGISLSHPLLLNHNKYSQLP